MAWVFVIIAGFFEVGFTTFMKLSEGFSRWPYTLGFVTSAAISFYLLTLATRTLSLGTAYAVWTGIGACGTALVGILFFQDSAHPLRLFFLVLIIASVVGLKYVEG